MGYFSVLVYTLTYRLDPFAYLLVSKTLQYRNFYNETIQVLSFQLIFRV